MRVLLVNLKHLYQRRSLWIVYAGVVMVVWFWSALSVTKGKVPFGGFLLGSLLLGLLVATLQMETASKPFSFCLPGHREAVRRLVLRVGIPAGLTHLLAPLAPPIRWKGLALDPHALSFQVLAVPLVLLPVVGLLQTLFYRKPVWLAFSIMLGLVVIMVSAMSLNLYQAVTPALAVGGTVLSWAVCVSILYRIAMHSDLVKR